jgi:hypothetical protein
MRRVANYFAASSRQLTAAVADCRQDQFLSCLCCSWRQG